MSPGKPTFTDARAFIRYTIIPTYAYVHLTLIPVAKEIKLNEIRTDALSESCIRG